MLKWRGNCGRQKQRRGTETECTRDKDTHRKKRERAEEVGSSATETEDSVGGRERWKRPDKGVQMYVTWRQGGRRRERGSV